ncbi:MAG: transcription antitermination factor NusB [Candidatus Omnitrophota bacterium]
MRNRTKAREFALQILYEMDVTQDTSEETIGNFFLLEERNEIDESLRAFIAQLVKGVEANKADIDAKISRYAANWELERMAVVDRNILRLGCFELLLRDDIPPKVSINEAVELAKKYSGTESGKFVNAILDKVKQEIKK